MSIATEFHSDTNSFKRLKHTPHTNTLNNNIDESHNETLFTHKTKSPFTRSTNNMQPVADFYRNKVVFITGVTGFVGKVLLEKLLRSFPDIGLIYLLIRSKHNQSIKTRLNDVIESKLFDMLRAAQPNFHEKLRIIEGDVTLPNLGIGEVDTKNLTESVNVVFHSAAAIRFNAPLKAALEMNVLPIQKLITLCRQCAHLQALVHLSTAFANCDRAEIDERVYPLDIDHNKLINSLMWMDDDMVDRITPDLLGNKPNTYIYTKHLGEHLLNTEGNGLPIAIVRPSIIGAAWKEPLPGWLDGFSGTVGLFVAMGKGMLRSFHCNYHAVAPIVPVDFTVNASVVSGWYTAVARPQKLMVYHSTMGLDNCYTWGQIESVLNVFYKQYPLDNAYRRPKIVITKHGLLHDYWTFVSHLIPAYFVDMAFTLIGKPPKMVKAYKKLHKFVDVLNYFVLNQWDFKHTNLDLLNEHLTPEERKTFYFDPHIVHWRTYIENSCLGTKTFVMNEDMAGLPAARAHLKKLRNMRYTFNTVLVIILWRFLIARSNFAKNLWHFILNLAFKFVRYFRVTSSLR